MSNRKRQKCDCDYCTSSRERNKILFDDDRREMENAVGVKIKVPADATRHDMVGVGIKCQGALLRTGDGDDRLSEHLGRIVVKCDECGDRFSLLAKKEEQ